MGVMSEQRLGNALETMSKIRDYMVDRSVDEIDPVKAEEIISSGLDDIKYVDDHFNAWGEEIQNMMLDPKHNNDNGLSNELATQITLRGILMERSKAMSLLAEGKAGEYAKRVKNKGRKGRALDAKRVKKRQDREQRGW